MRLLRGFFSIAAVVVLILCSAWAAHANTPEGQDPAGVCSSMPTSMSRFTSYWKGRQYVPGQSTHGQRSNSFVGAASSTHQNVGNPGKTVKYYAMAHQTAIYPPPKDPKWCPKCDPGTTVAGPALMLSSPSVAAQNKNIYNPAFQNHFVQLKSEDNSGSAGTLGNDFDFVKNPNGGGGALGANTVPPPPAGVDPTVWANWWTVYIVQGGWNCSGTPPAPAGISQAVWQAWWGTFIQQYQSILCGHNGGSGGGTGGGTGGLGGLGGLGGSTGGGASATGLTAQGNGPGDNKEVGAAAAANAIEAATAATELANEPEASMHAARTNNAMQQGSRASSAGEDANENEHAAFDCFTEQDLVNVANEDAGAPCSPKAASKNYSNVAWMVMQMYKNCYIPMAILFLLPGAIITGIKANVGKFFLVLPADDDVLSPFVGIARACVAIFLIPATQLAVSYCIDIGNSLQKECQPYVNLPEIYLWCQEQIQILSPDQQGNPIKNLPNVPFAAYRGKFAAMPVSGAIMEQMSGMDLALSELVNECYHMLTIGLDVIDAFQLVTVCYLFLLGPLAAAFFAWPTVGPSLFRRVFGSWLDAVVVVSLWKFWWNVVLICMTVRLDAGDVNPFDPFEVYYLIAFFAVLLAVPFNPFNFQAGEICAFIMTAASSVADKVAGGGKYGGGGGSKHAGKGHAMKGTI